MSTPRTSTNLQDVMLAMDAVDELRHTKALVDHELDATDRKGALVDRLRDIYREQGIEVSDELLNEGVELLEQERFTHKPQGNHWQRTVAHIYVARAKWLKPAMMAMIVGVTLWWLTARSVGSGFGLPSDVIPQHVQLRKAYVEAVGYGDSAMDGMIYMNRIDAINQKGKAAISSGDREAARTAIEELAALNENINARYRLQIINEPDQPPVVTRPADDGSRDTWYYLLIEPVGSRNWPVTVEVFSQDSGKRERVNRYGQQIPRALAEQILGEFHANGRINQRTVGTKHGMSFTPVFDIDIERRVITEW